MVTRLKVIGDMVIVVLNTGSLEGVRKEIIKNDNSLVVILLSKVVEKEFLQTL